MSDAPPKSALELVMERLKKRDAEAGVDAQPLTDEQKTAIAEARSICEAKTAERQILHRSKLTSTWDPAAREQLEEEYRRDLARFTEDRDRRIEKIRQGR